MSRRKGRNNTDYNRGNPLFDGNGAYWASASYNMRLFTMFRQQLINLAMVRFSWNDMPDTIDTRYLEWTLLTQSVATIAHPRRMPHSYYGTQVAYSGRLNVYDNPVKWESIGNNGWRFNVGRRSGVIVWDNMQRICIMDWLDLYARELCDIIRTMQMNRMHQKIPYVIKGDQTRRQDILNLYKMVIGGEPAVLAFNGIDAVDFDTLDTRVDYIGDKLNEQWQNCWNAAYTMLGIENLPFKSERRVTDEVDSLTMPTTLMSLNPLNSRRQALEELKRLDPDVFGNASVTWAQDNASTNYNMTHNLKQYMEATDGNTDVDELGADDAAPVATVSERRAGEFKDNPVPSD